MPGGPLDVLEIGAGAGLLSVLASIHPSVNKVVATDLEHVVSLLERNIMRNLDPLYPQSKVSVKCLDLKQAEDAPDVDLVLGADVIYDDALSAAVIGLLRQLATTSKSDTRVIFAFEKRWNFTLDTMAVTAPAFDFFMAGLADLKNELPDGALDWSLVGEDKETLPQFFCYERSNDLYLLRILIRIP